MSENKASMDEGFRDTRLLIANSRIASKQAALTRVITELNSVIEKKEILEKEINECLEIRDSLIIDGWLNDEPDWKVLLSRPETVSKVMTDRCERELDKLGLFTAGYYEGFSQRALGIAITGETSDDEVERIAVSLEKVFPYLCVLMNEERAVYVPHSSPESFALQLRQSVIDNSISVETISYGIRFSSYHRSFLDALKFVRSKMTGNMFKLDLREGLD